MKKTSGETRAGILAAAYSVLSQRGIEQTTIKEIARVAGVAPGLVHYYFASKDLLLQEVLQVAGMRYAAMIQRITGTAAGGAELSAVLMSCFDGLAIQKIIDPAFDIDRAYKMLHKLV